MNNLVFGKYIPIDSLMHRLDPRAKLIGLFLMIAAVFIPKSWWVFLVIALLPFRFGGFSFPLSVLSIS